MPQINLETLLQAILTAGIAFTVWQQRILVAMIKNTERRLDDCLQWKRTWGPDVENPPADGPPD